MHIITILIIVLLLYKSLLITNKFIKITLKTHCSVESLKQMDALVTSINVCLV